MSRRPGDTKTDTDMILNFLLTFVNFHGPEWGSAVKPVITELQFGTGTAPRHVENRPK